MEAHPLGKATQRKQHIRSQSVTKYEIFLKNEHLTKCLSLKKYWEFHEHVEGGDIIEKNFSPYLVLLEHSHFRNLQPMADGNPEIQKL